MIVSSVPFTGDKPTVLQGLGITVDDIASRPLSQLIQLSEKFPVFIDSEEMWNLLSHPDCVDFVKELCRWSDYSNTPNILGKLYAVINGDSVQETILFGNVTFIVRRGRL